MVAESVSVAVSVSVTVSVASVVMTCPNVIVEWMVTVLGNVRGGGGEGKETAIRSIRSDS